MKKLLYGSGILGLLFGLLYWYLPDLLELGVRSQITIQEGNRIYKDWIKFPVAINNEFRFFEVENPDEAMRGAKIRLRERGPFCMLQYRRKKVLWFSADQRRVKYFEYKTYYPDFSRNDCEKNWDSKMTILNAPVAALGGTIADVVRDNVPLPGITSPVIYGTVNTFLASHGQNLFMQRSAREMIYGFKINLLETISSLVKPLEALGVKGLLPEEGPKDNTFGLLYGRNNSPEGPYEMWTGVDDSTYNYAKFITWKDRKSLKWWAGERCNMIKGGDGTVFPPFVKKSDRLWVFNGDACRSIPFDYVKDSVFKDIPVLQFKIADEFFLSVDRFPDNECFCLHKTRRFRCQQNGVYDIGGCQAGAPVVLTKPHFLHSDPDLTQNVDGLSPNSELHDGILEVEPNTGGVVNGVGRLQFAFRLEQIPFLRGFSSIRNATVPLAWITEAGVVPDNLADELKNMLIIPVKVSSISIAGIAGASIFSFIIFSAMLLMRKKETKSVEEDANNNNQSQMSNEKNESNENGLNGIVPINNSNDVGHYNMAFTDDLTIQSYMPTNWSGIIFHPSQLIARNQVNPINMITNPSTRTLFMPINADMLTSSFASNFRSPINIDERIHGLSVDNQDYRSNVADLPAVENANLHQRSISDHDDGDDEDDDDERKNEQVELV